MAFKMFEAFPEETEMVQRGILDGLQKRLSVHGSNEREFVRASSNLGVDSDTESLLESASRHQKQKTGFYARSHTARIAIHMVACLFILLHLIFTGNYVFYKAKIYILNIREVFWRPWLVLLWCLEVVYFMCGILSALDHFLPPTKRVDLRLDGRYYPTVDIMIPCCKEPTEIPLESALAALKMDYPADRFKVQVLDDGGDDDLKAECESLQAESGERLVYLRRIKIPGKPHHFKCGNLNYGLEHSNAEYVVMMDADMILHPTFLRTLLPHIVNSPNISFVQIPQTFYNLPRGDPLNDSSTLGYDKVLDHRDSLGVATCIGTGCLFRRQHLDEIGGFQAQSITEDTTTAYSLFNQGYKSVYLNEKLQIGISPWTYEGFIKQRCRWGLGAFQQFKTTWRQMLGKNSKLTFMSKLLYFWHSGFYFLSIANLLVAATMLSALLFRFQFRVGTDEECRQLIVNLCYNFIFWRLSWTILWLQVPQAMQSRNRDEAMFWWMSPYFAKTIVQSFFSYDSTFTFVPTSTVDKIAAKGVESEWVKKLRQLKHVKFHLIYVVVILSVVAFKVYFAVFYYGLGDCRESFYVIGLSSFLLVTCVHMMLPILYILWPTSYKPSDRKSLLQYDADGVPIFDPTNYGLEYHSSVLLYEFVAIATFVLWVFVLYVAKTKADLRWCREGSF